MCAKDNSAELENKKRHQIHQINTLKYLNKETSYVRAGNRAGIGYSRSLGDIYSKALNTAGIGNTLNEETLRKYITTQKPGYESGSADDAGRNAVLALYAKQSKIQDKINNTFGRDLARAEIGALNQWQSQNAKNREKLGLPPNFGPQVIKENPSFFDKVQPALMIAGAALSGGASLAASGTNASGWLATQGAAWGSGLSALGSNWDGGPSYV
jgi:hypothetical protein